MLRMNLLGGVGGPALNVALVNRNIQMHLCNLVYLSLWQVSYMVVEWL